MLKKNYQQSLNFSKYLGLYDLLIPKENKWRRMNEEIDFSFVYDFVEDSYSTKMGRTAKDAVFII